MQVYLNKYEDITIQYWYYENEIIGYKKKIDLSNTMKYHGGMYVKTKSFKINISLKK